MTRRSVAFHRWRTFTSRVCNLLTGNPRETASTGLWKGQANWWRHRDLITTVCMYWSWLVLRPALWGLVTSGGGGFTTCGAPGSGFTDMMATTKLCPIKRTHKLWGFLLSSSSSGAFLHQITRGSQGTEASFIHSIHTTQGDLWMYLKKGLG